MGAPRGIQLVVLSTKIALLFAERRATDSYPTTEMATTPALNEFETRITSLVQGAIDDRLGPIIDRLSPLLTQSQPSQQPSGGESPPPYLYAAPSPVPRPALHTPPGVGVLSHDRRVAVAAKRHQAQAPGNTLRAGTGYHVPPQANVPVGHYRRSPARASGLNLTPSSPPPPSLPAYTGLDGGVPTAGDLSGISTFDPNEGMQPGDSGATPSTPTILLPGSSQGPPPKAPLLPGTSQGPPPKAPGTHIGEGLPPVPAKLVARIVRHEFVEMHELLPEFWHDQKDGGKTTDKAKSKKRALDLTVWLQCFAVYVGVLGPRFPAEVPELMAYMISIVRASQEYEGAAWAAYDTAYRRQAAAQGRTGWSQINPSLYAICFTGKAKKSERCDRCLSATHRADDCSLAAEDDPDVTKRLKAIKSAVVALTRPSSGGRPREPRERSSETCRNWNRNRCSFPGCLYTHLCTSCRGNHPALECPTRSSNTTPVGPHRRAPSGPRADPPY